MSKGDFKPILSRLLRVGAVAGVLLGFLFFLGQGCGDPVKSGGNGSGYGGLSPRPDGTYGTEFVGSTRGGPNVYTNNYFRFGSTVLCPSAPAAMGEVGPYVSGRIYFNDSFYFQPDLCAAASVLEMSAINYVAFNKEILVVGNAVHEFHVDPPQLLTEVRYHQAHCRALDPGAGATTGFVANVIRRNGQYFAEVLRGVRTVSGLLRFKVDEFAVARTVTAGGIAYQAPGFSLLVQANGPGSAATLELNWNGEAVNRSAVCW